MDKYLGEIELETPKHLLVKADENENVSHDEAVVPASDHGRPIEDTAIPLGTFINISICACQAGEPIGCLFLIEFRGLSICFPGISDAQKGHQKEQ